MSQFRDSPWIPPNPFVSSPFVADPFAIVGGGGGGGFAPGTYQMDFEDPDSASYLPFFAWQPSFFETVGEFLVLDNGAKNNLAQQGTKYLRVGKTWTYTTTQQTVRSIRFLIPAGAVSPSLSLWYRQFWAQADTLNIVLDQYADDTYGVPESSLNLLTRFGVGFATTREYTWTQITQGLVAEKWYEIRIEYFFRTTNPNFPSDQRPTTLGVFDATHNLGECLLIDNIEVSFS
jgi:hypothetical protein